MSDRVDRHATYEPGKKGYVCKVMIGFDQIEWSTEHYPTPFEWLQKEADLVLRLGQQTARARGPRRARSLDRELDDA